VIDVNTHRPAIAIIGAGFGGLAAAIELKKHGHNDIVLFERSNDVGWGLAPRTHTRRGMRRCRRRSTPSPSSPTRGGRGGTLDSPTSWITWRETAAKYGILRHIRFETK